MGNRKQPFGYKMEFGEIVPQPQEAETVRSIYLQYLAGASFKQLAERLQTEDVPYDGDKPWNKNMVARILEDDRYIGEKHFPALIPTEQFHAAQERRKEMHPEYKQTPAQKELRRLCGGIVPDSVARKVLKILKCIGALHLTVFRDFGAFPLGILWEVRPILSIVFVRSFPRVGHGVGQADASASKKPRTGFIVTFRFAISLS